LVDAGANKDTLRARHANLRDVHGPFHDCSNGQGLCLRHTIQYTARAVHVSVKFYLCALMR
jgi:hypothetical protein